MGSGGSPSLEVSMANRFLQQFSYFFERNVVTIFAKALIGASGAVTSFKGGGLASVVKESTAGQYLITLSDKYNQLLKVEGAVVHATISGVAAVQVLENPASIQADFLADKTFKIQCVDYTGAAVNPPSGAQIELEIKVRNSTSGPFD